jgi:hypothetical protein
MESEYPLLWLQASSANLCSELVGNIPCYHLIFFCLWPGASILKFNVFTVEFCAYV